MKRYKTKGNSGFQQQVIRHSIIAIIGLAIIGAASFGGSQRLESPAIQGNTNGKDAQWDVVGSRVITHQGKDFFDGRPIRPASTVRMRVTAYSPDERSCGRFADGITASGLSVLTNAGNLVAADTELLPFGSLVSIPGYACGDVVPVLDSGSAIVGTRLDVLHQAHEEAMAWGVRMLEVQIWEYSDEEGSDELMVNH